MIPVPTYTIPVMFLISCMVAVISADQMMKDAFTINMRLCGVSV